MNSVRSFIFHTAAVAALLTSATACGRSDDPAPRAYSAELTQAIDRILQQSVPGLQMVVTENGHNSFRAAGVGDLATGQPFSDDARIRIASNTKTFVATVVLQLVGEGKIDLDGPIERYLPGLLQGNGYAGNRITVRNLLQHTAGIPNYIDPAKLSKSVGNRHHQPLEADQVVRETLQTKAALGEPGTRMEYSNTSYLLAGMLIERVTGRTVQTEITERIIEPLHLTSTYYPEPGESTLRTPYAHGYDLVDGQLTEATELDAYGVGGADGALVSTGAELNRFFLALLDGRLLPPQLLSEMKRTVPSDLPLPGLQGAGLGLFRYELSCGLEVWGHGGSAPGFVTTGGVTADRRAVTLTTNLQPPTAQFVAALGDARDAAICSA
ncbi:serine hydrolase domain-containing protein [Nocardia sp. CA-107356]|uniref:serine hydrolase domain-containing protein n=1 Tax=Nocardia sp. CA-107356 TaxID=3239972 RepID=UPI003D904AEC